MRRYPSPSPPTFIRLDDIGACGPTFIQGVGEEGNTRKIYAIHTGFEPVLCSLIFGAVDDTTEPSTDFFYFYETGF